MSERINFGDLMMIVIISIDLGNLLKVNCHISYLKELPISINLLNFSCKLKILFFIAVVIHHSHILPFPQVDQNAVYLSNHIFS